ncbi:YidB family protein [Moraxella oculi]|uniref:YidB family protein n=1 Tax=Moraxella oculi TaxID=2940516 RepID=A0ABW8U8F5_9GAMM
MSLLQSIVTQVAQNALKDTKGVQNDMVGTALGGLLGGVGSQSQQGGLGGLLGSLVSGQANQSPANLGGLLGSFLGNQTQLTKSQSGGFDKSTLLLALLPVVLNYIQKNGGLSGVLSKLQGSGLGEKAQSWVNIDKDNDGIDAQDVARLFGNQEISEVCSQTGASEQEVCQGIADLLPQVVNDLTPKGDLGSEQQANDEIAQILSQLKGRF